MAEVEEVTEEIVEDVTEEEPVTEEKDFSEYVIAAYQSGILDCDYSAEEEGEELPQITDQEPDFALLEAIAEKQTFLSETWALLVELNPESEAASQSILRIHLDLENDTWNFISNIVFEERELPDEIQISDEGLEERALYLLDPYILPVVWWYGGDAEILNADVRTDIKPETAKTYYKQKYKLDFPEGYAPISRFADLDDMKRQTETMVTKDYAENCLYPLGEDSYLTYSDYFCWNYAVADVEFLRPQSATLLSRNDGVAQLLVTFEDGSQGEVELLLEDGIWKLNSTPYVENPNAAVWDGIVEGQASVEVLEERALHLLTPYISPDYWWLMAGQCLEDLSLDYEDIIHCDYTDGEEIFSICYCRVQRFSTIDEVKLATEQVFVQDYAEKMYAWGESHPYGRPMFVEQDGKLYGDEDCGRGAWNVADSAKLLGQKGNSYFFLVNYGWYDDDCYCIAQLTLEDGLWKLASSVKD